MKLWMVWRWLCDCATRGEHMGVFSTREKAEEACTTERDCVLGPLILDVRLPDEPVQPDDAYFPLRMVPGPGITKGGKPLPEVKLSDERVAQVVEAMRPLAKDHDR